MEHVETAAHGTGQPGEYVKMSKFGMWLFLASEIMFFTGFIATYITLRLSNPTIAEKSQNELNKVLAGANTLVLILSSLTMAMAVSAAQKGSKKALCVYLGITALLGATFLAVKGVEYNAKFTHSGITAKKEGDEIVVETADYLAQSKGLNKGYKILKFNDKEVTDPKRVEHVRLGSTLTFEDKNGDEHTIKLGILPGTNVFFGSYFVMTGFHGLHVLGGIVVLLLTLLWASMGRFGPDRYVFVENVGLYWHFVDIVWIFLFPLVYLMKF